MAGTNTEKQGEELKHIDIRGPQSFRVRWRDVNGQQQSRTFETKDDALYFRDQKLGQVEKVRRQIKLELRSPDDDATATMSFSELLDRFTSDELGDDGESATLAAATRRSYRESLGQFRMYFTKQGGDPLISAIKPKHVKTFLNWRRKHPRPVSKRTLQKDRAVLHRVFEYAIELELLDANPVRAKLGKVPTRTPVILSNEQFELLVAACADDATRTYVVLLNETGLRAESEALWLRKDDVDLDAGFVEVVS